MGFLKNIKDIAVGAFKYHSNSPSALFKYFISAVLIQFSVVSLMAIASGGQIKALPVLGMLSHSVEFWWGVLGLFGACSIIFEKYIKGSLPVLIAGYLSAIASLSLLSYDFLTTRPPVLTGGILATTSIIFLGGVLYGRIKNP